MYKISRFDAKTQEWSFAGSLNQARWGHSVIYVDSTFLLIGRYAYSYYSEACVLQGQNMRCRQLKTDVQQDNINPALFSTYQNYDDNC